MCLQMNTIMVLFIHIYLIITFFCNLFHRFFISSISESRQPYYQINKCEVQTKVLFKILVIL